jgi:phage terminase large subunit
MARRTRRAGPLAELQDIAVGALALVNPAEGLKRYRDDPAGFCRDVIGFEPWEGQEAVMGCLAEHRKVTVPSGRMVGKSRLDGALALWFAATRPGSTVVFTAPTARQVEKVLWHETQKLVRMLKIPIGIHCAERAATGAKTSTGSRIIGITSETPEGFQGIRDPEMLIIVDEASWVPDSIFDVINGNLSGSGYLLLTGNPTRTTGYFRESFRHDPLGEHGKVPGETFAVVHLPSTTSPNIIHHAPIFPGLADDDWLAERGREWGEDSPTYKMHVLGEVAEGVEGRLFSVELVAGSEALWLDTPPTGRLVIGVDPAGDSGEGDESAFCCRRGKKITHLLTKRGLTADAHVVETLGLIATQRGESVERPVVLIDREGAVGAKVYAALVGFQSQHETAFDLVGVRSSENAPGIYRTHDKKRDAMAFALLDALSDGVAIPEDLKLEREFQEIKSELNAQGRSKITPKEELRKVLGRSPDRWDALALACWNYANDGREHERAVAHSPPVNHNPYKDARSRGMDPYQGVFNGQIDPYKAWNK